MIRTRTDKGDPCCPICEVLVSTPGEFCSRGHYIHYIVAVAQMPPPVEVEDAPLTAREQGWYSTDQDGQYTTQP